MAYLTKLWNVLNKFPKMKDSIIVSLISGLLGTFAMDLSNVFLWRTKKAELLQGHIAGSMIMRSFRTNRTKNFLLGQIFHLITGAALGTPIFQLLKRTGKDHYIVKGGFAGLLSWGILYNFGRRIGLFTAKPRLTKTHYSALGNNFLYGIATAQAIVSLSDPSLLPERQQATDEKQNESANQINQQGHHLNNQNVIDESTTSIMLH